MNQRKAFKTLLTVRIVFFLIILIVVLISSLAYLHITLLDKSKEDLVNAYKVNTELEQLISYIKDAETGNRGYLLTKDSTFLEPYLISKQKVNVSLFELKNLLEGNASQLKRLSEVYNLVNLRYTYFVTNLAENYHFEHIAQSRLVMNELRVKVDELIVTQNELLEVRDKSYETKNYFTPFFSFSVFIIALLIMSLGYYNISKNFFAIQKSNKQLLLSIESNNQAEIISKSSSWVLNLESNVFRFSDNHYRLLGFEPNGFESTNDNFLKMVHPIDLKEVTDFMDKIMKDIKTETIQYRILKKDGNVKRLECTGKLYLDFFGKRNIIGITRDITEEYEKKIELELLLKELLERNQELLEFNHAVSHDLQEPLRKIQTFISRLKSVEELEQKVLDYLNKIENSSTRMRGLIGDLLQFSKVSLTKTNFMPIHLNNVLEESIAELSEEIREKGVEIKYCDLPIVKGVYFQFKQLFINLLSNSIKYSMSNKPPIIKITHKMVHPKDEILPQNAKNMNYHQFIFKDNGMGFNQEYAEKVFLLFERLHGKKDYPGTGVGLAICKKIIEAHNGFIHAVSESKKGTSIIFYIPVLE